MHGTSTSTYTFWAILRQQQVGKKKTKTIRSWWFQPIRIIINMVEHKVIRHHQLARVTPPKQILTDI